MAEAKAFVIIPKSDKKATEIVLDMYPLVLCEDCKHSGLDSSGINGYWCSKHTEWHDADWFCADVEERN